MTIHNLKIDVAPFNDLLSGAKTGEVRNDDRGFEVGDTVYLTCTDGRKSSRTISHIQRGYGLPIGLCVLSYTRATPYADTLAGLVRYDVSALWGRIVSTVGEYILHSEAAAVVERLKVDASKHAHDAETVRRQRDEEYSLRKAAEAELAQNKAQDPVAWAAKNKDGEIYSVHLERYDAKGTYLNNAHPLYASPVSDSLKAENERYKEALQDIRKNAVGSMVPSSVITALVDAALNVEASDG